MKHKILAQRIAYMTRSSADADKPVRRHVIAYFRFSKWRPSAIL